MKTILITKTELHQIIKEEIKRELLEQQAIEEGVKDFFKRNAFPAITIGLAMAILGPIYKGTTDAQQKRKGERIEQALENTIESNTKVETQKDFAEYLNTNAAFRWGKGGQRMMVDKKEGMAVMPLSFTVAMMAYEDKAQGNAPRFGIPDKLMKLNAEPTTTPEQATRNLDKFFDDFNFAYVNALQVSSGVVKTLPTDVGPEGGVYDVVMVDPVAVADGDMANYVLPENQKTVQEYYNWLYFSQYLSIEDVQTIANKISPDNLEARQKIQQLFIDANPDLVKLEKQAQSLQKDPSTED
jgi:hypothetical protein